jgi:hypothetical protein
MRASGHIYTLPYDLVMGAGTEQTAARGRDAVRQVPVPPAVRELSTLARLDYADTFLVDVGAVGRRTAEEWARHVFDAAPAPTRAGLVAAWWTLGFDLRPWRRDGHVLGWAIRRSDADHVVIGAGSPLGLSAELLVKRQEPKLLFATCIEQRSTAGRALWAAVAHGHPAVVRAVMSSASRRSLEH